MLAVERGIADVFATLQGWLVATGATGSMLRLAWALLAVLWLGYIATSTRPGRDPDLIDAFGRLAVAGGLLTAVGSVTHVIVAGFEALRGAGTAVLDGLVGQSWSQFVQEWLTPQMGTMFNLVGPWFAYPWAMAVLAIGLILGVLLFAFGVMVYLAILFFAHLTLVLAIFLAPLALALLAAPSTQRWTARWVAVIVRTGLVVFCVRVIHAAVLYLAVIVPVREVASTMQTGPQQPGGTPDGGPAALLGLLLRLTWFLFLMLVGTGMGVYVMLRSERLIGQFIDGVAFGEHILGGPLWLRGQAAGWHARSGGDYAEPNVTVPAGGDRQPWGSGRAQDATTVMKAGGRFS